MLPILSGIVMPAGIIAVVVAEDKPGRLSPLHPATVAPFARTARGPNPGR